MTNPVNLSQARKTKARETAKAKAVENRAKFGQAKAQRTLRDKLAEQTAKALDGARRDP